VPGDPGLHFVVMGHTGGHEHTALAHAFGQLQGMAAFAAAAAAQNQYFVGFGHDDFFKGSLSIGSCFESGY
jgi:hypothetical protein